jgi:pantothenate kinase
VPLVVTEGNYLLVDLGEWAALRSLLDEVWYLDPDEESRIDWLVRRHKAFGRDDDAARARALGSDQRNAELIVTTRDRADVVVTGTRGAFGG